MKTWRWCLDVLHGLWYDSISVPKTHNEYVIIKFMNNTDKDVFLEKTKFSKMLCVMKKGA